MMATDVDIPSRARVLLAKRLPAIVPMEIERRYRRPENIDEARAKLLRLLASREARA